MRDRTAARNYSPAADEFRKEHERHRAWGLARRHATKLQRIREQAAADVGAVELSLTESIPPDYAAAEFDVMESVDAEARRAERVGAAQTGAESGGAASDNRGSDGAEGVVAKSGGAESGAAEAGVGESGAAEAGVGESGVAEASGAEASGAETDDAEAGVVESGVAESSVAESKVAELSVAIAWAAVAVKKDVSARRTVSLVEDVGRDDSCAAWLPIRRRCLRIRYSDGVHFGRGPPILSLQLAP